MLGKKKKFCIFRMYSQKTVQESEPYNYSGSYFQTIILLHSNTVVLTIVLQIQA